jgi:hypothetical protein
LEPTFRLCWQIPWVRRGRYGVLASSPALGLVISALKLILALFEACLVPELMLRRGCGSFAGIGAMAGVASAISEPSAPVRLSSVLLVDVLQQELDQTVRVSAIVSEIEALHQLLLLCLIDNARGLAYL